MPPMPKPELPKPVDRSHQKMVDLDNDKQVEPPPDAKYLAQKNNRAEVETRATDTNLQKAQKGTGLGGAVQPRGHAGRRRQGEDRRARGPEVGAGSQGARGHAAREPELSQPETPEPQKPKSLLALRDAPRRARTS